ncbi:hypothetical protein Gotur_018020 [Gossypium turneri]
MQNYLKKQSNEEKTSTDQDEDIKVSTYNSDEENTSSEDENIEIPEPMRNLLYLMIYNSITYTVSSMRN